jgi:hypothetical protein
MSRARDIAIHAMHAWMLPGQPPQLWMCSQNEAVRRGVSPYGMHMIRVAELHRESLGAAGVAIGSTWSDPDVGWLALAILMEGP